MVAQNEVRMRVRSTALDLIEFTVEKMHQETGLNADSIRTELMRMKELGYLTSRPLSKGRSGRGAPPHLYKVTDDDDKLNELCDSVERFVRPDSGVGRKPNSLNYAAASTLLDQLETNGVPAVNFTDVADEVVRLMELAKEDLGIGVFQDDRTLVFSAYLDILRARLALVQGFWPRAETYLDKARTIFKRYSVDYGVQECDTVTNALMIRKLLSETIDSVSVTQSLEDVFTELSGNIPVAIMGELFERVRKAREDASQKMRHQDLPLRAMDQRYPFQYPDLEPDTGTANNMVDVVVELSEQDKRRLSAFIERARKSTEVRITDKQIYKLLQTSTLLRQLKLLKSSGERGDEIPVLNMWGLVELVEDERFSSAVLDPVLAFLLDELCSVPT